MSDRGYRAVTAEWFAYGDDRQRAFPLRYAGFRTNNVSEVSAISCKNWQGVVRLSAASRTNWLYPSDASSRWGFYGADRVSTTRGLPDPAGSNTTSRIICLLGGRDVGPHYIGTSSPLVSGQEYTFAVALRGVKGGESVRVGVDSHIVPATRITLTTQWQLVTYTAPYNTGDGYVIRLMLPRVGDGIEYAFAGLYHPKDVGAAIVTTIEPASVIDYALEGTTVTLPAPLKKQESLLWDGHVYWLERKSLLPPNATRLEHNLAKVGARVGDIPTPLTDLWNPISSPENLLPWLAWGLSVDTWNSDWPLHIRRARVASAIPIQQIKGTAKSVRDVVESFGGNVQIVEWWQEVPPAPAHTFKLTVTLSGQGDSGGSSRFVEEVIAEVNRTKPVRSHFTFIQGVEFFGQVGTKAALRPCVLARLPLEAL